MWEVEDRFVVRLGGNTYINCDSLVSFRGTPLFTLKRTDDGYLGIDFDIYNAEGYKVATVKHNQVHYGGKDKDRYREEGSANRYTLTDTTTGKVICDIKKREAARPAELNVSVHMYTSTGFLFDATPEQTNLGGVKLRNNVIQDCGTGIDIR